MRIVCIGGGPAGLYFALLMKKQDPAHEITRGRAQPALRHLRLGRGVLRPDAGQHARLGRRDRRRRSSGAFNHWDDIEVNIHGRADALGRPRLLRHRPQAAAQHPAGALRGARRRAGVRDRGAEPTRDYPDADLDHRQRRREQPHPRAATPRSTSPTSTDAAEPLRLARHAQALRRLHLRLPQDASMAGSRPMPTSSTTTPRPSSSRRRRRCCRAHGLDKAGAGRVHRLLRGAVRRGTWTATRLMSNAAHLRGSASGSSSRASSASTWVHLQRPAAGRADGRRRAHRAFLDRLGHQARARGRDRAGPQFIGRATRATDRPPCSTPTRTCAASRCCGSRTRRATRPSGSRTCDRYCRTCRPSSSPIRC